MSTLQKIVNWFTTARPKPTPKDFNVQAGVHFEEVGEMLDAVRSLDPVTGAAIEDAKVCLKALADRLKTVEPGDGIMVNDGDRLEFLDALCDQVVTTIGCAGAARPNLDIAGGLEEVANSNWSKFEDGLPIFDENGKIIKGSNYFKPDLKRFV